MVRVSPWAFVLWAVWILLLPLQWLMSAVLAAAVHELFHIFAAVLLGGRVREVQIGCIGAVIELEDIQGLRECLCALAGPLGSFLLVLFIHKMPILGLCALVQGCFNLLPIYPLDGGRALACLFL